MALLRGINGPWLWHTTQDSVVQMHDQVEDRFGMFSAREKGIVTLISRVQETGGGKSLKQQYLPVHVPYLVSIHKWLFCPISASCLKNNPQNIKHMPVVIFFARLDLEQKSSFMDRHYLQASKVTI